MRERSFIRLSFYRVLVCIGDFMPHFMVSHGRMGDNPPGPAWTPGWQKGLLREGIRRELVGAGCQ